MKRRLFTEEHAMFRDAFRRFCEKEIVPYNEQWEKDGVVSREMWRHAGENGFLGMQVPEKYGGGGVEDFAYASIMQEETARINAVSAGLGLSLHNDIVLPYVLHYGNEVQKQRWLPGLCSSRPLRCRLRTCLPAKRTSDTTAMPIKRIANAALVIFTPFL